MELTNEFKTISTVFCSKNPLKWHHYCRHATSNNDFRPTLWENDDYKLGLSPGAWKFKGSWVRSSLDTHSDCKLISYTRNSNFNLAYLWHKNSMQTQFFYRNKYEYTVVRSQCNKTGPFGPNHIFFIKSLILGVHEWIYNYFDCFSLKKSFKMTPLLSTCDQ